MFLVKRKTDGKVIAERKEYNSAKSYIEKNNLRHTCFVESTEPPKILPETEPGAPDSKQQYTADRGELSLSEVQTFFNRLGEADEKIKAQAVVISLMNSFQASKKEVVGVLEFFVQVANEIQE